LKIEVAVELLNLINLMQATAAVGKPGLRKYSELRPGTSSPQISGGRAPRRYPVQMTTWPWQVAEQISVVTFSGHHTWQVMLEHINYLF
jgi:hypothetical protein